MNNDDSSARFESLEKHVSDLESRIARVEKQLSIEGDGMSSDSNQPGQIETAESGDSLELRIGLYLFAKAGVLAFLIGMFFFLVQPFHDLPDLFSPVAGCVIAGIVIILSRRLRRNVPFVSGYLLGAGLCLLYLSTMRLHFFGGNAVENAVVETCLLFAIAVASLLVSVRKRSPYLTGLSMTMGYIASLLVNSEEAFLILISVLVIGSAFIAVKYHWQNVSTFCTGLTLISVIEWLLNNPILSHNVQIRSASLAAPAFVILWLVIFSGENLFRAGKPLESIALIMGSLLNGAGMFILILFISVTELQPEIFLVNVAASLVFLLLAVGFWISEKSRYQTFFYAVLGYAALSIAIVARFGLSNSIIWLCWQSILVVSTAVWFRSKFIVVANFGIYVIIFISYLAFTGREGITGISFGLAALLSARILNWQKHRLDLKTELMRNAYLTAAFVMIPYALYSILPGKYVSLSWVGVALVYYVLSRVLENLKYRWLSLLTFILTAFYLLFVGIGALESSFRIVSFLVLGSAFLIISVLYAKSRIRSH